MCQPWRTRPHTYTHWCERSCIFGKQFGDPWAVNRTVDEHNPASHIIYATYVAIANITSLWVSTVAETGLNYPWDFSNFFGPSSCVSRPTCRILSGWLCRRRRKPCWRSMLPMKPRIEKVWTIQLAGSGWDDITGTSLALRNSESWKKMSSDCC